jgi:hypothetical protein
MDTIVPTVDKVNEDILEKDETETDDVDEDKDEDKDKDVEVNPDDDESFVPGVDLDDNDEDEDDAVCDNNDNADDVGEDQEKHSWMRMCAWACMAQL